MRFDARVRREYRLLRDPVAWTESGDLACASDISRNEYARKPDEGLMWCEGPDSETRGGVRCELWHIWQAKTGESGLLLKPSELRDLMLIEAATTLATTNEERRALGRPWFKEKRKIKRPRAKHKIQEQIELEEWSRNDKKHRILVYVEETMEKDGNIWGSDDWPDLVHQHFVDLCRALEVEIMTEKGARKLVPCSNDAWRTRTGRTSTRFFGWEKGAGAYRKKMQARRI